MSGVLGPGPDAARVRAATPVVDAVAGLRVGHRVSRFVGVVVSIDNEAVTLRSDDGATRNFRIVEEAFVIERAGKLVTVNLRRPRPRPESAPGGAPGRTASGSIAATGPHIARVAAASRLWVEGLHDAELVERVWGDDLRELGIVVEALHGLDRADDAVARFGPGPDRRLGILVDHLVAGSKEDRIAQSLVGEWGPWLAVEGHPYLDVWQAVRPARLGWDRWPVVPRGRSFKAEIGAALGQPDDRATWRLIQSRVRTWTDLEPAFVGPVEALIDFVTAAHDQAI
jgi:hypothetical protein